MRRWVVLMLLIGLAGVLVGRIGVERTADRGRREQALLYLPNGDYLRAASLGHPTLLADAIYLWAIQYYSDYQNEDRYDYVEHIFGEVVTKLDPHYVDAYWLGALILIVEAHQLDRGLALLDRGIEANPRDWLLPYMAAWECHGAGRYDEAGEYFALSASREEAPTFVRRMRAGMLAKSGNLEGALAHWVEVLNSAGDDQRAEDIALRQIRNLTIRLDVRRLREAVDRYRDGHGTPPPSLEGLVRAGLLAEVPLDPDGAPYRYDRQTGTIDPPRLSGVLDSP